MAAATGYGDAPAEEELLAYRDLPTPGRDMAEIFAVRVHAAAGERGGEKHPPCGSIFFHGGNSCSDLVYSRNQSETDEEPAVPQPCDSEGNLVLTGPSVATSAYGPVVFDLHLHNGSQTEPPSPQAEADDDAAADDNNTNTNTNTGRIFCDTVSGEFSTYDRAITQTVTTAYGPVDVVYAVLSNAVEGRVAVKLTTLPAGGAAAGVVGTVVARSKLLDAGCVLFYNEFHGEDVPVRSGELLPLARQALAVPLHKPLVVELNLRSGSREEIVRGAVEFTPAITGQQTERVVGVSGAVLEVTVSWSDYPW